MQHSQTTSQHGNTYPCPTRKCVSVSIVPTRKHISVSPMTHVVAIGSPEWQLRESHSLKSLELGQRHYPQRRSVFDRLHCGGIPRRYCLGIVLRQRHFCRRRETLLLGQCFLSRHHSAFGQLLAALLHGQRFLRRLRSAFGRLSAALLRGQHVLHRRRSAFG